MSMSPTTNEYVYRRSASDYDIIMVDDHSSSNISAFNDNDGIIADSDDLDYSTFERH